MGEKQIPVKKIDGNRWMIERQGSMHTSGIVYASEAMLPKIMADQSLQQVHNVACLPGIVGSALACPIFTGATGFRSAGWLLSTWTRAWSHRAGWAMISIAVCA